MRYRDFAAKDLEAVNTINAQPQHGYDLETPEFVLGGVVEDDDGNIIGFGGVKVIYECVIILDQVAPKKSRIEALKLLIRNGCALSKRKGIQFWHAFCDQEFGLFLQKWFEYKPAEGIAVILNTDHGVGNVEKRRKEDERAPGNGPLIGQGSVRRNHQGTSARATSSQ